jgi:hypothetical protein
VSGSRQSFRATAAQRLAEDGGALPAAVEEFLSDTRRMTVRLLPLRLVDLAGSRQAAIDASGGPVDLDALVDSVRQHGILEPILVRPLAGGRHEVVAGERRYLAARSAGLDAIPAVVRELDAEIAGTLVAARARERADTAAAGMTQAAEVAPTTGPGRVGSDPVEVSVPASVSSSRSVDQVRRVDLARAGEHLRTRPSTNGTYMPPAVVTRREPVVISGPGIPGPAARAQAADAPAIEEHRRVVGGDDERRPRFRFAPFPFLRRSGDGSGEHR